MTVWPVFLISEYVCAVLLVGVIVLAEKETWDIRQLAEVGILLFSILASGSHTFFSVGGGPFAGRDLVGNGALGVADGKCLNNREVFDGLSGGEYVSGPPFVCERRAAGDCPASVRPGVSGVFLYAGFVSDQRVFRDARP